MLPLAQIAAVLSTDQITPVGVIGMLLYLFVRELFSFLKKRNNRNGGHNATAGEMSKEAWLMLFRDMFDPVLTSQREIKRLLEEVLHKMP